VSAFRQKYNAVRRPVAAQNRSEKLENRLFRNFVVSDPKNATEPSAFKGKHLFITHVDVFNKREDITA
jgi:hypothetical protein